MSGDLYAQREYFRKKAHRAATWKRRGLTALFLAPYLIVFAIFFVYPFFYGFYISFFKWNLTDSSKIQFVGLDNYINLLTKQDYLYHNYFIEGMKNTLLFVGISVPLLLIVPLGLALLINLKPPGYKLFRILFFMPTVLSVSAVALIWKWQFDTNSGFINGLAKLLGMKGETAWLSTQPYAWIAITATTVWWTTGTNMVIFGAGLKEVDKSLYEAAGIDGCNGVKSFFHITLPSIKNQFIICLITTIIASFNIYGQPTLMTAGGPNKSTIVLLMRIRELLFANGQAGVASAMAIMLGIIIIIISILQNVLTKERIKKSYDLKAKKKHC